MDLNADGSASTNATTKKNASFKATAEIRLLSILIVPRIGVWPVLTTIVEVGPLQERVQH